MPKANRLTKESDFKLLAKKGKPFYSPQITFKLLKNNQQESRFGIVISAKVSKKAVVRNQLKRRISEILRLSLAKIKPGFDVMILINKALIEKNYQEIEKELNSLLKKTKLL